MTVELKYLKPGEIVCLRIGAGDTSGDGKADVNVAMAIFLLGEHVLESGPIPVPVQQIAAGAAMLVGGVLGALPLPAPFKMFARGAIGIAQSLTVPDLPFKLLTAGG